MRRAILLTALVALALPTRVARASDDDDRPFRRGTILPSIGLGGSYSRSFGGSLAVGAGASYFVVGGFAVGLHLRNVTTFYSQGYKDYLGPDLIAQIPTNEFSIKPGFMWVLYRGARVAPYISAGVGPVFLNKKRGVLGEWTAGPGIMIGTGGPLWIDLGLTFGMRFTRSRCQDAYSYYDPISAVTYTSGYACGLIFGFRGGIVFGIGGRRQPRNPPPPPPPTYESRPPSSYPQPYTQPPSQPVPSASPPPNAAPPLEGTPEGPPPPATPPPEGTPPAATPPSATPPSATPPATTPPATPPGESVYVPPPA